MTVRVAVPGATGRMGRELLGAATDRDELTVVAATSRSPEAGPVSGIDLDPAEELPRLLAERDVDVLVDFTVPEASLRYVDAAVEANVAVVTGTTGYDDSGFETLREASESVPVLRAANFARGVQALMRLVREAAAALPSYDAELTEAHHNGKRDAPSGTAKTILDEFETARAERDADAADEPRRVYGREGHAPREEGEIGVHAVRAGDITGRHELLLAGNHEELRLTHRAGDRGVFAAGALDAAAWLAGRDAGWYDFGEVIDGE